MFIRIKDNIYNVEEIISLQKHNFGMQEDGISIQTRAGTDLVAFDNESERDKIFEEISNILIEKDYK